MTGLIIVLALVGVAFAFLSIYVLFLSISTMRAHRRAADAISRKIEADRLAQQQRNVGGTY